MNNLKPEERASIALRGLYQSYGYRLYKVNRFEAYDLYMRYKRFLTDERVLAFSDTDGKLMALKPDITLSIVKNTRDEETPLKVCYTESAYRVPRNAYGFGEIMQTGVEYIGRVSTYVMGEMVMLAAKSLSLISPNYALDVSDMGILTGVLASETLGEEGQRALLKAVSAKNVHELSALCAGLGVCAKTCDLLKSLVALGGPFAKTLERVQTLGLPDTCREALEGLRGVNRMLAVYDLPGVNLDFSAVNDMNYYNGLIFSGFVEGIAGSVLSGGRYDPLLTSMGRHSQGIGFAVYLDQLDRLSPRQEPDLDVLILCDERTDPALAARRAQMLTAQGKRVCVQETLRGCCREVLDLRGKGEDAQ